jgi:membrane-bound metal-dependent hydrolase YbcI (DUF457 family)
VASVFSHAVAALGIGACFYRPHIPKRVWLIGVTCSILPDVDVLGFQFGVRYGDFWGHRGFTHSLIFAALTASVALILGFWRGGLVVGRLYLWTLFLLSRRQPWTIGRHDRWRSRSCFFFALR